MKNFLLLFICAIFISTSFAINLSSAQERINWVEGIQLYDNGKCEPKKYEGLRMDVQNACIASKSCAPKTKNSFISIDNAILNEKCAQARQRLSDTCWQGAERNNTKVKNALKAAKICRGEISIIVERDKETGDYKRTEIINQKTN